MRGKRATRRKIQADVKYSSVSVAKFINYMMQRGKKSVAQTILYRAFESVEKKTGKEPLSVFELAMKNVSPVVEVKTRRIGGGNFQVPIEVRGDRKEYLAMRWLIDAARKKKGKPMYEKISQELLDASDGHGDAIKKKEDVHRMAEANRAFVHFV